MASWPGGIGAITLFVEDVDATKRFYGEASAPARARPDLSCGG